MKSHVCEEIQGPATPLSLHWPAVEQAQEKKYLFMMTCKFFLTLKISVMFVGVCWSMLETFSSAIFALCFNLSSKLIGFRQQKELFRHSQCPI